MEKSEQETIRQVAYWYVVLSIGIMFIYLLSGDLYTNLGMMIKYAIFLFYIQGKNNWHNLVGFLTLLTILFSLVSYQSWLSLVDIAGLSFIMAHVYYRTNIKMVSRPRKKK